MKRISLIVAGIAVAAVTAALGARTAAAGSSCPPPPASSAAFAQLGDSSSYVLANDGSFDPISGKSLSSPWTLAGGASIVSDQEPMNLGAGTTTSALALPAGSSATSACTTAPLITSVVRFFVRSTGSPTGHLHIEVLVNGGKNGVLDGGTITAGPGWAPTDPIVISWPHPLKGAVQLQVRLTPVEPDASFVVDDVFIDPFNSR